MALQKNKDAPLRMYVFNYDSYGLFYIVLSTSKEEALRVVKKYTGSRRENSGPHSDWSKATLNKLPEGYFLVEYGEGEIFEGEWC